MVTDQTPILVIGGAGYIGSHMVLMLRAAGYPVVVLDNLSSGHAEAVQDAELVVGDIGDAALLDRLFAQHRFGCVMHFASSIQVGESVRDPGKYYDNNVARTVTLLNAMVRHKVQPFIFSSTAAVFGNPDYTPINETHPTRPINPYGSTKHMVEQMLADYANAHGFVYGCLRYFNACGADPEGRVGECHEPETHLIPLALQAISGKRPALSVFGEDYPTPDGTCIRDYIHIVDLCDAHMKLMHYLQQGGTERCFNLGTGQGFSVREVLLAAEKATGKPVPHQVVGRREGDPAILIADGSKARALLGWSPRYSDLDTILRHAWAWENQHAHG
jgi:UDP-glucose 4-epimerase